MPDQPLANDASARDSAGTIVDQAGSGLGTTETTTSTDTQTQEQPSTAQTETSTEPTPKEGDTLLADGKEPEKPKAEGAPEKYADFKLPEGIKLDGDQLTAATTLFKESGLSQDAAQKMVDFHVAALKEAAEAGGKAYEAMRADWQTKSKSDPDIAKVTADGKTGLDAVKINVAKVYNAIGDPKLVGEFKELMNLTGTGDNPAFIKVMNKLADFVVEGKHVSGKGPSEHGQSNTGTQQKPTAAQAMYPNLPSSARS